MGEDQDEGVVFLAAVVGGDVVLVHVHLKLRVQVGYELPALVRARWYQSNIFMVASPYAGSRVW